MKIIKSKRFEGVVLWEGDLPPNKVVDIEKTDENIQIYLNNRMTAWLDENPETDDSNNYLDWKEIAVQEHWLELGEEFLDKNSSIIALEHTEKVYIKMLIEDAGLEINFEIIEVENGNREVRLFDETKCVHLHRDKAHEVLEECILSRNIHDYFWYLAFKQKQPTF